MKARLVFAGLLAVLTSVNVAAGSAAAAGTRCVDPGKASCFSTIQAALDAANSGNTITFAARRSAGPITIAKSVKLVGAGAGATVIQGGGPVLTIGELTGRTPTQ